MFSNLLNFLSDFLASEAVDLWAPIPLEECTVRKPYLLDRAGISSGTAFIFAIPYFTRACEDPGRNLSAYAVSRDYHGFFSSFYSRLLPLLRNRFPEHRFEGFADHSPIDEVTAAAKAGIGILGDNHLLLTQKYSSYVFLGELITDMEVPCHIGIPEHCPSCGECMRHCPADACGGCLSALTQKKGILTPEEQEALVRYGSAWGCDICQEVCPFTKRARDAGTIYSPIPYFNEQTISRLTIHVLDGMSDEEFAGRAFAWRGRETVRRNLLLFIKSDQTD